MSELKPCPFCGGESTENRDISNSIYCKKCFAEIDTDCVDWNTRPIEDALHARIAELDAEVTKGHELQDAYCDRIAELENEHNVWLIGASNAVKNLEARIAELEAAQRWIPVSERLPELDQDVLAIVDDDIVIGDFRQEWDGEIYFSRDEVGSTRYVTHWMPLPELPKECE